MKSCDMETPGQTQTGRTIMTHQAYQPILPTGNKYLQQKWDKASYDLHRARVKTAKPTINITPPKAYTHLSLKLKTQKIDRENNMLLEKISHIMRTTGRVDNMNYYEKKSLGKERRQLEMRRITKENQMIQLRLSQCRSHYNLRSWHEDWLQTLKMMDRIARYPRGQANQQKYQGQETPSKKTAHASSSNKANGKAESEETEKGKETSEKESTKTKIQQEVTHPESNTPEKSISPDTPESPGSSGIIQPTTEKPGDTAETCSPSETPEQETASPVG